MEFTNSNDYALIFARKKAQRFILSIFMDNVMFHQITFYRQSLGPTAPALNLNGTAENVLHAVDEKKEAI